MPRKSAIQARVPTLPTPTTLRARSTKRNCSSRCRRSVSMRAPVGADQLVDLSLERFSLSLGGDQLVDRDDQRRVADDPAFAVDVCGQFLEGVHAVLRASLRDICFGLLEPLRIDAAGELRKRLLNRQMRIPKLQVAHRCERAHRLPVGPHGVEHDRPPLLGGEARLASGDREARRQPLHVPLPWPRQRLVEIIHVEHQRPLGRAEDAKVRQVRVATQLRSKARRRRARQIRRHDQRAATIEGKRRRKHPAIADRYQLGNPRGRLLLQQRDRIAPGGELDLRVCRPRHLGPRRFAPRRPLHPREMRHHLRGRLRVSPTVGCISNARTTFRDLVGAGHISLPLLGQQAAVPAGGSIPLEASYACGARAQVDPSVTRR